MITALDHIAIAVPDLERAINRFMEDFGITFEGTEDVLAAKTTTAFFPIDGTSIELVHPLNGEGPLVQHLEKRGPGIHSQLAMNNPWLTLLFKRGAIAGNFLGGR